MKISFSFSVIEEYDNKSDKTTLCRRQSVLYKMIETQCRTRKIQNIWHGNLKIYRDVFSRTVVHFSFCNWASEVRNTESKLRTSSQSIPIKSEKIEVGEPTKQPKIPSQTLQIVVLSILNFSIEPVCHVAIEMSEVFEGYERQYCELSANLSRKSNSAALLPDHGIVLFFHFLLI